MSATDPFPRWDRHPKLGMRAQALKGANQFDPKIYLMHDTLDKYVGPFDTFEDAFLYRKAHKLAAFAVVRTSKPREAEEPKF